MASLAPLAAVLLFMAAIVLAFGYLRVEEADREREALRRDVEYAQQRLRLRLLDQQEQVMQLASELVRQELRPDAVAQRAQAIIAQNPEIQTLTWLNAQRRVVMTQSALSLAPLWSPGELLTDEEAELNFSLVRDVRQPVFAQPVLLSPAAAPPAPMAGSAPSALTAPDNSPLPPAPPATDPGLARPPSTLPALQAAPMLMLQVPLLQHGQFAGVLMAQFAPERLLRHGVPDEVASKYAVSLQDRADHLLAGQAIARKPSALPSWLPAPAERLEAVQVPVTPVGNALVLRAEVWRTSLGIIGSTLFGWVAALSALTAWMLLANWRHSRRRAQAQKALEAETTFRRAMENSMLTGMRVLDLQGCITYVNPAFCQMTGWSEAELVGTRAPFAYWPEDDRETLQRLLDEELNGLTPPGGFQMQALRKDGSLFDARMYVSPLIDAQGRQSGWITSMTDITEPNRIRQQLSASYERFTTVLEALDASVSVAPLAGGELLFGNRLYRLWFGSLARGHHQLARSAQRPDEAAAGEMPDETPLSSSATAPGAARDDTMDAVDHLAGLPTSGLTADATDASGNPADASAAHTASVELYLPALDKWLEVRARYLNWVDGRLAQMVIATDITGRRQAQEQAAAQAEKAQAASRLITMGEMASSVAHELNQPLTAINNYCSGLISRIRNQRVHTDELLGALEKTARQAQRAGQIIQRIRSFVKRSEPNRSLSDAARMVEEAVELAGIEMRRRNVQLRHHVAPRLPQLRVDPILIEQVLINLLKNAAESVDTAKRPVGQRAVALHVTQQMVDGAAAIEFTVTDSGRGLAPETMAHLFEAFYTTKTEGMGIGLNLCRTIVESHQGRLQARNLYNGDKIAGCCFSFWLPVDPASEPAIEKSAE